MRTNPPEDAHSTEGRPLTILIVEDEAATAWALSLRFQDEGYEALTAPSAEKALEMIRARHFDVVVADLRLPGMSGVDLIRRLARRKRVIPAIAVTADGTPATLRRVLGAGARQCFLKPFQVERLVEGVHQALHGEAA